MKNSSTDKIPLPFALGGIGLFWTYLFKGGLLGWQGFLIGFAIGLYLIRFKSENDDNKAAKCPKCGFEWDEDTNKSKLFKDSKKHFNHE